MKNVTFVKTATYALTLMTLVACGGIDLSGFFADLAEIFGSIRLEADCEEWQGKFKYDDSGKPEMTKSSGNITLFLSAIDPTSGGRFDVDAPKDSTPEEENAFLAAVVPFEGITLYSSAGCAGEGTFHAMSGVVATMHECSTDECNARVLRSQNGDEVARRVGFSIPPQAIAEFVIAHSDSEAVSFRAKVSVNNAAAGMDPSTIIPLEANTCINVSSNLGE